MTEIHPTAIVHPNIKLKRGVKIGPYSVIDSPDVILEEDVEIKSHVHIAGNVHVKKGTKIYPFASIGSPPQKHHYIEQEKNPIEIGENCEIREYVSINSSHGAGEKVTIGDRCFIMAYCHIAHNCRIGNFVTMANGATLGGHVVVGDYANFGGLCAIHQWCMIGEHAMVGGGTMASNDIPPFSLVAGYPVKLNGLNWIGLKRRNVPHEALMSLVKAYRITCKSRMTWKEAREELVNTVEMNPYLHKWIEFCDNSKRGLPPIREKAVQSSNSSQLAEIG